MRSRRQIIQGMRSKMKNEVVEVSAVEDDRTDLSTMLWKGLLYNVLNPQAPVYLVSVFTVVFSPNMPLWQLVVYGTWMMILQFVWFAVMMFMLS